MTNGVTGDSGGALDVDDDDADDGTWLPSPNRTRRRSRVLDRALNDRAPFPSSSIFLSDDQNDDDRKDLKCLNISKTINSSQWKLYDI